jgi:hypothetical protein
VLFRSVPFFLDRLKEIREIEERLAEQQAEMNEETRSVLAKNMS